MTTVTRRRFIGTLAAVASATRVVRAGDRRLDRIGLQLYTLRDVMKRDPVGVLAKVAEVGYTDVEFAGYFGQPPRVLAGALARNRLRSPSAHVPFAAVRGDLARTVADAVQIGHGYLVVSAPPEVRDTTRLDDWKRFADALNTAADTCRKSSLQLGYHNRHFEFASVEGRRPYDLLLEACDKALVVMQVDLCWMTAAGADVQDYLQKLRGRVPLVHVKDVSRTLAPGWDTQRPIPQSGSLGVDGEVGSGIIQWAQVMAAAVDAGVHHVYVEHDNAPSPLDSIRGSYQYLRRLRF